MGFIQRTFSTRQFPFVMLTAGSIVWLLCLSLFQDGMFIDGIQYAAVSRNLACGVGTFWNPVLAQNSVAGLNSFHEHPPLVFFIQSLFFKLFGLNNIYPERFYCLVTFLVTAMFMAFIWWRIFEGQRTKQLWWLSILLWTIMPIVFWAYTNDIQENTVGAFTTASVYFFICAVQSGRVLLSTGFYLGCASVLLAGFCKGIPGLFPAGFFFIYWLSSKEIKFGQALVYSLAVVAILGIAVWLVIQNATAKDALHLWFFDRMLKRISDDPTENSHFYILTGLFTEQLPALILTATVIIIYKVKAVKNEINHSYFILFALLGFSASFPLMLTLVQRNFYFIPALPLFAIAWALLIADGLNYALDYLEQLPQLKKGIACFAVVALTAGVITTIALSGKVKRDKEMLHDVYAIQKQVPQNSFVSVTSDIMWLDWSFRCYMMRYDEISFSDKDTCNYYITKHDGPVADKFIKAGTPLDLYQLYKRKKEK